jgi:Uma2 family endonuclease
MAVVFESWPKEPDDIVVKHGVSWAQFEAYLEQRGDALPRVTYLEGTLELMSPSAHHEGIKKLLAIILEEYLDSLDITFQGVGAWLLKQSKAEAGLEPDECYILGGGEKERPDLAIEVVWTSGGVQKLEIYRRLGVGEVWFWIEGRVHIFVLVGDRYEERSRSACLPKFDFDVVTELSQLAHHSAVKKAARARFAATSSSSS